MSQNYGVPVILAGLLIGLIILATASFFVDLTIQHPFLMLMFMVLTAVTFSMLGFIIGIFLITLAISMAIPMLTLLIFELPEDLNAFLWSSLITFIAGMTMIVQGRPKARQQVKPCFGGRHGPGRAVEQTYAEAVFQLDQSATDELLGQAQLIGR